MDKLGATGKYPQGKLNESDEGELRMRVEANSDSGKVIIDFGTPVAWMALCPYDAEALSKALLRRAQEIRINACVVSVNADKSEDKT